MKKFGKGLLAGILGVAFFGMNAMSSEAAPADSVANMYKQPSGEAFEAQLSGDEYLNYVLANDTGDLIDQKEDDYWYYSVLDEETKQTKASDRKYLIDQRPENALSYKDISTLEREEQSLETPSSSKARVSSSALWKQEQPLLVILVEFADTPLKYSETDWEKRVFSQTEKSLHTYYKEITNDAIRIIPAKESDGKQDGIIRIKLDQNHPNPGNTFDLARPALKEALESIQDSIDITAYDTNGNGIIEQNELHIMGIFAGYENSSISTSPKVWGHKGSFQGRPIGYPTVDGVKLNNYTLFGEVMLNKTTNSEYQSELGLVTHEFGHDLKLPDLYNSAKTVIEQDGKYIEVSDGDGLGKYSLMASGSWTYITGENPGATPPHLDAYCKVALGIVTPQVITETQTVDVKHISEAGFNVFRINTENPQEYFLVENRQLIGADEALKTVTYSSEHGYKPIVASGGIGVYHVNERYTGNMSTQEQLVTLKEADEGILGYSKLNKPRYYATNNYDGFYYQGMGGHGKEQQTVLSKTTTPSTVISSGSYPEYSMTVHSAPDNSMSVTFIGKSVDVTGVTVSPTSKELTVGETQQLTATVSPSNATNKAVSWSSSNTNVVTASSSGLVTAKAAGTATITVTTEDGNKQAVASISVKEPEIPAKAVTMDMPIEEIYVGETLQLTAAVLPENATNKKIIWSSTNPSVASVSDSGLVTANSVGSEDSRAYVYITAQTEDGSKKINKNLAIAVPDDHGNIDRKSTLLKAGEAVSFKADYDKDIDYFHLTGKAGNYAVTVRIDEPLPNNKKIHFSNYGVNIMKNWNNHYNVAFTKNSADGMEFVEIINLPTDDAVFSGLITEGSYASNSELPAGVKGTIRVDKIADNIFDSYASQMTGGIEIAEDESVVIDTTINWPEEFKHINFDELYHLDVLNSELAEVQDGNRIVGKKAGKTKVGFSKNNSLEGVVFGGLILPFIKQYDLLVKDDHGNTAESGTLLESGKATSFKTDYYNDNDYFQIQGEPGYYSMLIRIDEALPDGAKIDFSFNGMNTTKNWSSYSNLALVKKSTDGREYVAVFNLPNKDSTFSGLIKTGNVASNSYLPEGVTGTIQIDRIPDSVFEESTSQLTVKVGEQIKVSTVIDVPDNLEYISFDELYTFSISSSSLYEINSNGIITGKAEGKATINCFLKNSSIEGVTFAGLSLPFLKGRSLLIQAADK